jgi:hypothetical protein
MHEGYVLMRNTTSIGEEMAGFICEDLGRDVAERSQY